MSILLPLVALLALTPEAPADAVIEQIDPDYQRCIADLEKDPDAVRRRAEDWLRDGGGAAALHCQALGDLAAGHAGVAAVRLEELAGRPDAGDKLVRARILSQAALAWLEAEKPAEAKRVIAAAFGYAPEGGDLYLAAAKVYLANQEYQAAINAIDTAEAQGFKSADGYTTRGRAKLALSDTRGAADDVIAALKLDQLFVDALVLRGDLHQRGVDIGATVKQTR